MNYRNNENKYTTRDESGKVEGYFVCYEFTERRRGDLSLVVGTDVFDKF